MTQTTIKKNWLAYNNTCCFRCVCGEDVTEGQGNSKKSSKRRAAELMLDKLRSNGVVKPLSKPKTKTATNKKKNRNLIKVDDKIYLLY